MSNVWMLEINISRSTVRDGVFLKPVRDTQFCAGCVAVNEWELTDDNGWVYLWQKCGRMDSQYKSNIYYMNIYEYMMVGN